MTIGIYALIFKGTDQIYIGQSINIEQRYIKHLYRLKNYLANYKLLEAYNLYGIPKLEIICECSREELNHLEEELISELDTVNKGLNIRSKPAGGGTSLRGQFHPNSICSNIQVLNVFQLLINRKNLSFKQIAEITGTSIDIVRDISKGKAHLWLKDICPEEYAILINIKGTRVVNSAVLKGIKYPLIESPTGEIFNIENISEFARVHGLNKSHLCGVLNRKRKSHLGWKLK